MVYRFDEYRINLAGRDLRRGADAVALSPMVFDCIAYLIEHRNRAVGRDELIAAVWGKTDVAYSLLGQLVAKARRALGGSGSDTNVIRTIPGFGYQWVAALSRQDDREAESDSEIEVTDASGVPVAQSIVGNRRVTVGVLATAVLALVTWVLTWQVRNRGPQSELPAAISPTAERTLADTVAVLPIEVDTTTDPDSTWVRFGLMDYVTTRLRQSSLAVVPSTDIIYLTRGTASRADMIEQVRRATGVLQVIVPTATRTVDGWTVRLELEAGENRQVVQAQAGDSVRAARDAADKLLIALGKRPSPLPSLTSSKTELLQRLEAALLAGNATDGKRLIDAAPAALRESPEIQLGMARTDVAANEFDSARKRLMALQTSVLAETDPVLRARVLITHGRMELGNSGAASLFSEAIALLEDRNEPAYLGDAYNGRGIASLRNQQKDEARADYARARIAYALAHNTLRLAAVDNNEAELDMRNARPAEALPLFERAAEAFDRFGALDRLAAPLINQISAHLLLLQPEAALAVYRQNRNKLARLEDVKTFHIFECLGAQALAANGSLSEAEALLDAIASDLHGVHERDVLAVVHKLQSGIAFAAGDTKRAMTLGREAVDGLKTLFVSERADAWLILIRALRELNDGATAAGETKKFHAWSLGVFDADVAIRAQLAEAEQHWTDGRQSEGTSAYEEALRLAHKDGTPQDIAFAVDSYGRRLLESGDLAGASTVIGECGRWISQDFSCALLQAELYRALGRNDMWQSTLAKARELAGERPISTDVASPPEEPLATTPPREPSGAAAQLLANP